MSKTEGFVVLNTKDGEDTMDWTKLVLQYLSNKTTSKIKINGEIKNIGESAKNVAILKKACQELLSKIGNSEDDELIAKNWCNKNSPLINRK